MNPLSRNQHQNATKCSGDQDTSIKQNYKTSPAKIKELQSNFN